MSEFGNPEAEHLLASGWLQGAMFAANDIVGIPEGIDEGTLLVVITQSCTAVSNSLTRDPFIEIAVVVPEGKAYKATTQEATGKVFRKLSVPLSTGADPESGVIDINRRYFVPRERFLEFKPDGPDVKSVIAKPLGGWVGRYYTRAALPNLLNAELADIKFSETIEKCLKQKPKEANETFHELMTVIFGKWNPDDEVGPYALDLAFICNSGPDADDFADLLSTKFGEIPISITAGKVTVNIDILDAESVYLNQYHKWHRITQWDHFSALSEELVPG
ncbi:hypothetical protein [Ensifer adhaerens]